MSNLVLFPTGRKDSSLITPCETGVMVVQWTADPCGLVTQVNQQWEELTGQTQMEVIKWGWLEMIHPEDRERTARRWCKSIAAGIEYMNNFRISCRGKQLYVVNCARPHVGKDGRILCWNGVAGIASMKLQQTDSLNNLILAAI